MSAKIVPLRGRTPQNSTAPSAPELVERARLLAIDTLNIRMDHPHLRQRLAQRGLGMRHVLETIYTGRALGAPTLDKHGDWRIKIERLVAGRRVQVVIAVKEDHMVVVTAI